MKAPSRRLSPVLFLALLSCVLAFAVFRSGGVVQSDRHIYSLGLGVLALAYQLPIFRGNPAPPLRGALRWLVFLPPAYAALQLLPLPLSWLRVLSPARAELLEAMRPVALTPAYASLSVFPPATLTGFFLTAGYTAVFLMVRELSWQFHERPWMVASPVIVIAVLESAFGLLQYATGGPNGYATGTYPNKNHFAGLLGMALPFATMYAVLHAWQKAEPGRFGPSLKAILGFSCAALILAAMIFSFSRMGFFAALVSVCAVGVLSVGSGASRRKKWLTLACVCVLFPLLFIFLPPERLIQRFAQPLVANDASTDVRLALWRDSLSLIAAYPVFGCGLGAFEAGFYKYQVSAPLMTVAYAHNDYLQFMAELGLAGFVIVAALFLTLLAKSLQSLRRQTDCVRCLLLAGVGAMIAIFVHSSVDYNLHIPANAMTLAWISGISAGLWAPGFSLPRSRM